MFYVFNMLLPCFLITLVALLGKIEYLQSRLQSLSLSKKALTKNVVDKRKVSSTDEHCFGVVFSYKLGAQKKLSKTPYIAGLARHQIISCVS